MTRGFPSGWELLGRAFHDRRLGRDELQILAIILRHRDLNGAPEPLSDLHLCYLSGLDRHAVSQARTLLAAAGWLPSNVQAIRACTADRSQDGGR